VAVVSGYLVWAGAGRDWRTTGLQRAASQNDENPRFRLLGIGLVRIRGPNLVPSCLHQVPAPGPLRSGAEVNFGRAAGGGIVRGTTGVLLHLTTYDKSEGSIEDLGDEIGFPFRS
jgi:hypothetical protein